MAISYRVIDLRLDGLNAEHEVTGVLSPERAAAQVLGVDVVRSGRTNDLVAKVYFQPLGQPICMVRMYSRKEVSVADDAAAFSRQ